LSKTIVTGQQIGLLGGPLYTTYKVLGATLLAGKLKGKAVYWLETNDADFEEINRINYLDAQGSLQSLRWEKNSRGFSCGFIDVDKKLVNLLNLFFDTIHQTEFTEGLKKIALDAYVPGKRLGEASIDLAKSLFGTLKISLFDSQNTDFLQASRDTLLKEAERTEPGNQANLFCMVNKKRVAVFRTETGFFSRKGESLDLRKYNLVPNVMTRNVIQDLYFGTHTYVAGPGELEYIKKLDEMYASYGVKKARVINRMSVTLIEPRIRKLLKKLDVGISDIIEKKRDEFLYGITRKIIGFDAKQVLKEGKELTDDYITGIDKLGLDTKKIRKLLYGQVKEMVGTKRALEKNAQVSLLQKAGFLYDNVYPFGKRQERVFNLFYYLNLYGGITFINWLIKNYNPDLNILEINHET